MIFLKIAIALAVCVAWILIDGSRDFALFLGGFVLIVLFISPKRQKSYEEGEDFKAMLKEKQERKVFLEEERINEKKQNDKKK